MKIFSQCVENRLTQNFRKSILSDDFITMRFYFEVRVSRREYVNRISIENKCFEKVEFVDMMI